MGGAIRQARRHRVEGVGRSRSDTGREFRCHAIRGKLRGARSQSAGRCDTLRCAYYWVHPLLRVFQPPLQF